MVNYEKSTIYKIVCKDVNIKDCYVGSTTNFNRRKQEHKYNCNNVNSKKYNLNVYQYIRENGGFSNFDIIEIERYSALDKNDLYKRERFWLEILKANLNSYNPITSEEEKKQQKKEYDKKRAKTDKKKECNKEQNEKRKLDKVNCDICNKEMRRDSLNTHKKTIHNIH